MKTSTMQRIDRIIGPTMGWFLLGIGMLIRRGANAKPNNPNIKKILVIKFLGLGTIMLTSPALRRLKAIYPAAEITLLTASQNQAISYMLPAVDKVVCIEVNSISGLLKSLCYVLPVLIKQKFDIVVNTEFFANFSALITLSISVFNPKAMMLGYDCPRSWRNKVYQGRVTFDHKIHICENILGFTRILSPYAKGEYNLSFDEEKRELLKNAQTGFLKTIEEGNNVSQRYFIAVNINSGDLCENRRWPLEYFAELITQLQKKENVIIFLIGTASDKNYVDSFLSLLKSKENIINLCGKTSIYELIGLLSKTSLFISNDSGPMHLAAALGIMTVALFGPETPVLYGPVGNKKHVFYSHPKCSPCLTIRNSKYSKCRDNICLKKITPALVLSAIDDKVNF